MEYVERNAIEQAIRNATHGATTLANSQHFISATRMVPASDVVPAVRCKDCTYWKYVS